MEFLFSQLRKMDVVSVSDGKNLGRVCDMAFLFPEGKIKGFYVTGSKGFKFTKSDVFIPLADVVKIGEDVVLVKTGQGKPPKGEQCPPPQSNCPPQPPCPPNGRPPYPPYPPQQPHCPPFAQTDPRRNFDDYE
ncbi:MAG: PRC-barrel domain-containing protein [Clostridia bacterium]|nr:PRC-barrel domain-containing protein [Clostridia bacterium]